MAKQIISKHNINGSSKVWTIAKYDDGSFSCNCPAWIFHRGKKVDCKHILEFKQQKQEVTINITGLEAKNEKTAENEAHNSSTIENSEQGNDNLLSKLQHLHSENLKEFF